MENPLRIFAGVKRASAPLDRTPSDEARLARAAHEDLQRMGMPRVNLLLSGREPFVQRVLANLFSNLLEPVVIWSPAQPLVLPPPERPATLILHEVGALVIHEQIRLIEWISLSNGRAQVVSTTTTPLLPRVEVGAFIDTLYYRLNMVCVEESD